LEFVANLAGGLPAAVEKALALTGAKLAIPIIAPGFRRFPFNTGTGEELESGLRPNIQRDVPPGGGGGTPTDPPPKNPATPQDNSAPQQTPFERGAQFERDALQAMGVPANKKRLSITFEDGSTATVIPDAFDGVTIIEVKDVAGLYNSRQFRAYLASNKKIRLVVSPKNKKDINAAAGSHQSIRWVD
jgi:hypothetical protein